MAPSSPRPLLSSGPPALLQLLLLLRLLPAAPGPRGGLSLACPGGGGGAAPWGARPRCLALRAPPWSGVAPGSPWAREGWDRLLGPRLVSFSLCAPPSPALDKDLKDGKLTWKRFTKLPVFRPLRKGFVVGASRVRGWRIERGAEASNCRPLSPGLRCGPVGRAIQGRTLARCWPSRDGRGSPG